MTPSAAPAEALQMVCAEIWGGNRPIDRSIELTGVRGRLYSKPCDGGRGGDVHYLSICNSGVLTRMCVADVAGHGESVAHVSGELHQLLRRFMDHNDQRRVLAELNGRLLREKSPPLTTAAIVTYYPPSGALSLSYAGHPPAWLYRARRERWERLPIEERAAGLADLPLSVADEAVFSRRSERVAAGDRLLVVSDGVLEAPDAAHRLFDDGGVERVLDEHRAAPVDELAKRLLEALTAHTGSAALEHDDVTILLVEFSRTSRLSTPLRALCNRVLRRRGNSAAAVSW